jgi:hypothetical protein
LFGEPFGRFLVEPSAELNGYFAAEGSAELWQGQFRQRVRPT